MKSRLMMNVAFNSSSLLGPTAGYTLGLNVVAAKKFRIDDGETFASHSGRAAESRISFSLAFCFATPRRMKIPPKAGRERQKPGCGLGHPGGRNPESEERVGVGGSETLVDILSCLLSTTCQKTNRNEPEIRCAAGPTISTVGEQWRSAAKRHQPDLRFPQKQPKSQNSTNKAVRL